MNKLSSFRELGLSEDMLLALKRKGFEEPTPIQQRIIPLLLTEAGDFVGQAQTGTGKTAAFGIPIIEKLQERKGYIQTLILTPTRELAIQVSEELNSLRGRKRLHIIPIYGGQSLNLQFQRLKRGVDVVVATPGRMLDHIRRGTIDLSRVSYVVLDEADEMLNMGFIEDVGDILSVANPERTTLLFSATMPREIVTVARRYMKDYRVIRTQKESRPVELTDQIYFEVSAGDKFEALCRIIDLENEFYGLIFCRTKVDVDEISARLIDRGYDAEGLHGDISQRQREVILDRFRKKHLTILVATDVAARGIDIHNLTHVINYAIPQDPDSYVHRIGRTGRAGNRGTAITFITPEEYRRLHYIKREARAHIRKEKVPQIGEIIEAKKARIKSEIEQISREEISEPFSRMAEELLEDADPHMVLAALLKHAYAGELDPTNYNEIRNGHPRIQGKTRLFIAKGRRDQMTRRRLASFIQQIAGVDPRKIDDIQVLENFSFVTVPLREAEVILQAFRRQSNGKRPLVSVARK